MSWNAVSDQRPSCARLVRNSSVLRHVSTGKIGKIRTMPLSEQATDFLKYAFAETKDLSKHFLTVVTAVLVFSLTFSEKIANFSGARPVVRWSIVAAWCCMFLAI